MHYDGAWWEAMPKARPIWPGQSAFPARLAEDGRSLGLPWACSYHCEGLSGSDLAEVSAALFHTRRWEVALESRHGDRLKLHSVRYASSRRVDRSHAPAR